MSGILAILAASGSSGSGISFTPVAGTYLVTDNGSGGVDAVYTIAASTSVAWTYSISGLASANVVNGNSASSITFTLVQGTSDRTSTITVTADGKTWNLTLTATGSSGGVVMTL